MMSAIVSIPATLALKRIATDAIEFEDALVGVQKTTNLASDAMEEMARTGKSAGNNMLPLSKRLRELSLTPPPPV
jgi:hypothetical protein